MHLYVPKLHRMQLVLFFYYSILGYVSRVRRMGSGFTQGPAGSRVYEKTVSCFFRNPAFQASPVYTAISCAQNPALSAKERDFKFKDSSLKCDADLDWL